jgi:hypothetical protein
LPHFWHIQSFIVNLDTMPLKKIQIFQVMYFEKVKITPINTRGDGGIQYNSIQYNKIQHNTLQYNTIQKNIIMQCNTKQRVILSPVDTPGYNRVGTRCLRGVSIPLRVVASTVKPINSYFCTHWLIISDIKVNYRFHKEIESNFALNVSTMYMIN